VLLAGDFRQVLPVIRHGRRSDIVDAALSRSRLWNSVTVLKLKRNMRVKNCGGDESKRRQLKKHAEWLIELGDGKLPTTADGDVGIPSELCVPTKEDLINFVFGDLKEHHDDLPWISMRAILCPLNETVDRINDHVLELFPGYSVTCLSVDSVAEVDQQAIYPVEYLNFLNLSGLPPHKLQLKLGIPIMLLRNIDPAHGHCNGTQYIVQHIGSRYIKAAIACGEYANNELFIPRVQLSPTEAGLPFTLRRRQFPVRPSFAMTINKAQGQTLQCAGVLLGEPVFTHGQLYIVASRCGDPDNIRFCVQNSQTTNVVCTEVLST